MTLTVSANNGTAPASALATLPGYNGDGTPHTAPHVTVSSYARLRAAMSAAGQGDLLPTADGWSCYRDRAAQQHMRDIGLTTIPVGQSIHGEWTYGSAVDFGGLGGFGSARHNWLKGNAGPYGWYQPSWAQANGSLPESWHWEYDERNDQHQGEEPDDMTPEQAAKLDATKADTGEIHRILAFMITGVGAGSDAEANYVHKEKQVVEDTHENRRMLGVQMGWNPPAPGTPEEQALPKLWGQTLGALSRGPALLVLAIVVLLAIVAGVAVGLLADTQEGVIAGVAAIAGGLLVTILRNLPHSDS